MNFSPRIAQTLASPVPNTVFTSLETRQSLPEEVKCGPTYFESCMHLNALGRASLLRVIGTQTMYNGLTSREN